MKTAPFGQDPPARVRPTLPPRAICRDSLIFTHWHCTNLVEWCTLALDERDRSAIVLIAEEILDQPRAWSRASGLARETREALPPRERIAVIGCGSSWYAAKAVAALRERNGGGETDAFAASEALLGRSYDRVVAISRSGATSEIRRALELVQDGTTTVALVGDPLSPVATECDLVVDLSFAADRSVVQTRFVTTTVCFVRAALELSIDGLIADAEIAVAEPHPVDPSEVDRVVILGREWSVGLADAGALTLRETAQAWAESYPAMEYRHGPIATAGTGAVVWLLGQAPPGLVEEIATTGAAVLTARLDPLAEVIRIQRLAVALADHRGLDPDRPANLERAVVRDPIESGGAS
jgi:fructoselysine-6-P-deglycase FrlB-like protein